MADSLIPSHLIDSLNSLSQYQKIGLVLSLAYFGPNWRPDFASTESLLLWAPVLFLLATSSNLSGSLRFGDHKYGRVVTSYVQRIPSWILVVPVLLPVSRMWLTIVVAITWQYIRSQHAQVVEELGSQVDSICSVASLAAKHALEDYITAASCETQAVEIAAVALRDRRCAQSLHSTDFFKESMQAWTSMRNVAIAARDATSAANTVSDDAMEIAQAVAADETRTNELVQQAKLTWQWASQAEAAAQQTCARVTEFSSTREKHDEMRKNENTNATRAFDAVIEVAGNTDKACKAARSAAEKAEEVRRLGVRAKEAAVKGMMDDAKGMVKDAGRLKEEVKQEEEKAATAKTKARNSLKLVAGPRKV